MSMPTDAPPARYDPGLFAAVVSAGGSSSFDTARFLHLVTSPDTRLRTRLRARFGARRLVLFEAVFAFAVSGARAKHPGALAKPSVTPSDLGIALYRAGMQGGRFQIEHLFDRLFGPQTHDAVMAAVARRFGASGEIAYHGVLTALLIDLGATAAADASGAASPMTMASGSPPMTMASGSPPMMMASGSPPMTMAPNAHGVSSLAAMRGMNADRMSMRAMPSVTDVGVPMSREGSGTSWLPDSTTTYGHMTMLGETMLMTHGAGFVRYSDSASERGSRTLNAPNWFMAMLSHPLGQTSQIGVRAMTSADFVTVGGFGYPELFQTGETYAGRALHDHQHPHDLVSEAAVTFSHQMTPGSSLSVYIGYPGEPALGPPTYMHRAIAYDMADSPIGHHWEDSSHVTFGVVTAGIASGPVKLEGSAFTGREPNEVRTNFDRPHLDSYSGRLSLNPNANVSTQISYGFIRSPEALTPGIDRRRITVSILTNRPLGFGEYFTTSTVFGQNADSDGSPRSNAFLFEADLHRAFGSVYTRAEFVQKSGSELALDEDPGVLALHPAATKALYPIGAFSLGFVRDTRLANSGTILGLGAQVTSNTRPGGLRPFYGTQAPYTFELFARFRPGALR